MPALVRLPQPAAGWNLTRVQPVEQAPAHFFPGWSAKGETATRKTVRWNRGHDVDAHRTVPDRRIVEIRHHEQQRLKRLQRRPMHRDAVEPGDVHVAVRRQFDAIMIVRGEMLMDGRMRVMRVGIVPVGLRQSCPEREARDEREPNDPRGAQLCEHGGADYGRWVVGRQTLGVARDGSSLSYRSLLIVWCLSSAGSMRNRVPWSSAVSTYKRPSGP